MKMREMRAQWRLPALFHSWN